MCHLELEHDQRLLLAEESQQLRDADKALKGFIASLHEKVWKRCGRGGKLSVSDVKYLECMTRDLVGDRLTVFYSRTDIVEATRLRPNAQEFEICYVGAHRIPVPVPDTDELYQLYSLRVYGSRKKVRIDYREHPVAFQYHAAERLMERGKNVETAFRDIACQLALWYPFVAHFDRPSAKLTNSVLHIPAMNGTGMLLGEYVKSPAFEFTRQNYDRDGMTSSAHVAHEARLFVVRTFVGKMRLRPAQDQAVAMMDQWFLKHGVTMEDAFQDVFWPYVGLEDSPALFRRLSGECAADLDAMMSDDRVKGVMTKKERQVQPASATPEMLFASAVFKKPEIISTMGRIGGSFHALPGARAGNVTGAMRGSSLLTSALRPPPVSSVHWPTWAS